MNGDNGVQLYSAHARELRHTQQHKVMKFVEYGCVEYDRENRVFLCKPIEGYNSTTYEIRNSKEFEWECNCQGFQSAKRRYEKTRMPGCRVAPMLGLSGNG